MSNNNKGFNVQGSKSIFDQEPFDTQFKGFAEASPVEPAHDPAGSGNATPPTGNSPKGKKTAVWNTVGIVVIILLIIGISNSVAERREAVMEGESKTDLTAEELEQLAALVFSGEESTSSDATADDTQLVDRSDAGRPNDANLPAYSLTTNVKLAMLADPAVVNGKQRGCDVVYMLEREIIPTRAPLNAALRELFKKDAQPDFLPGNFLASQTKLVFINATIDNGVARVYLTGEVGPYEDGCDQNRAFVQVEETALQFATVRAVEIYLDGKKLIVN